MEWRGLFVENTQSRDLYTQKARAETTDPDSPSALCWLPSLRSARVELYGFPSGDPR
jgi:hypothetical protein